MTKLVQLSEEAYARLRGMKRRDESFSDVVLRLVGKDDLRWLIGRRSKTEIEEHRRLIRDVDELERARSQRGRP